MKEGVLMRSKANLLKEVDWATFKKAHFHNLDDTQLKVSLNFLLNISKSFTRKFEMSVVAK